VPSICSFALRRVSVSTRRCGKKGDKSFFAAICGRWEDIFSLSYPRTGVALCPKRPVSRGKWTYPLFFVHFHACGSGFIFVLRNKNSAQNQSCFLCCYAFERCSIGLHKSFSDVWGANGTKGSMLKPTCDLGELPKNDKNFELLILQFFCPFTSTDQ
jgi:hypothetical protein